MLDVYCNGKLVASCTTPEAAQAARRLIDDSPSWLDIEFPKIPTIELPFIPAWPPGAPDW